MSAILIVWQLDVVDDVCQGAFKQLPVTREDVLDILIHDRNEFNTLFLDKRASCCFIQLRHFLHNHQAFILSHNKHMIVSKDMQALSGINIASLIIKRMIDLPIHG